jgi:hypothetical protein
MFGLIRRFLIGWLLVRVLRRLTRGSTTRKASDRGR